jgi:hypothetical protein
VPSFGPWGLPSLTHFTPHVNLKELAALFRLPFYYIIGVQKRDKTRRVTSDIFISLSLLKDKRDFKDTRRDISILTISSI